MNKKLVLYSEQEIFENREVDLKFLELIGKDNPKIGYIPSRSDLEKNYLKFRERVAYYKQYGITNLFYFDLDQEYDEKKIKELLLCDAIHLSGGNTFHFLHLLKKRKFILIIQNFVKKRRSINWSERGKYFNVQDY